MVALVSSPTWKVWHAVSPHLNLRNARAHASFTKFSVTPDELANEELRAKINECEAVVVDYNNSYAMEFYTNGPKFLIWGDEHCHTKEEVSGTEELHAKYDYVLVGAPFSTPKKDRYLYVSDECKARRLYFPPCVGDERPEALPWDQRLSRAILPSNICPHVYPFRWKCGQLASDGSPIDNLPHFKSVHEEFFKLLGTYKYGITCNSYKWLNYTVAKYFEMPWMGSVLIATPPSDKECKLIGFEHGKNALFTDNPHEALRFINDGSHEAISIAGAELMMKYHTASKRLDYITKLVERARSSSRLGLEDSAEIFEHLKHGG